MSKSVWIHIIFGNACSTLGLWVEKIGGSEIFLILIPYLGPLVHSDSIPLPCRQDSNLEMVFSSSLQKIMSAVSNLWSESGIILLFAMALISLTTDLLILSKYFNLIFKIFFQKNVSNLMSK